jgi:hypothetical protein
MVVGSDPLMVRTMYGGAVFVALNQNNEFVLIIYLGGLPSRVR